MALFTADMKVEYFPSKQVLLLGSHLGDGNKMSLSR